MSTSEPAAGATPPRGRGRRPAEDVRADILVAAADLLFTAGIDAVTFDRVATASATSRTTIYKWWATPGALAAEAYFARVEHTLDFPDTGDIEQDLRTQLRAFVRLMSTETAGRAIRQLIGAAQVDPTLRRAFADNYSHPRRDEAVAALERARERGELPPDAPLGAIVDQLWGACYHRILILDEPVDDHLIDQLLGTLFHGAARQPTK